MLLFAEYRRLEHDTMEHLFIVVRLVDNTYLRRAAAQAKTPPRKQAR